MQVGEVSSQKQHTSISLRGSAMKSPVGNSYNEYLKQALLQEMQAANIYSGVSATIVSAELLENDINIAGFVTGNGNISAKFKVVRNDQQLFEKVISHSIEFDSSPTYLTLSLLQ